MTGKQRNGTEAGGGQEGRATARGVSPSNFFYNFFISHIGRPVLGSAFFICVLVDLACCSSALTFLGIVYCE